MSITRILVFALFLSAIFGIIASIETASATSLSPLEQYQQYRAKYGKDTAREDIMDNGIIDNSVNSIEYSYSEFGLLQKNKQDTANLEIQRTIPSNEPFVYHWEQNSTDIGSEYSSYINQPVTATFLNNKVTVPDSSASEKLLDRYGILLSDEKGKWDLEKSFALLETMESIPQNINTQIQEQKVIKSKWVISDKHIDGDLTITKTDTYKTVEISTDAFESATHRIALVDNKMGKYFSQKLHHALVRFVTDDGNNEDAVEKILNDRFGVSIKVPDYSVLTQSTTKESAKSFQKFHPAELVTIIDIFEEMPKGFHSVEGLDYIVRRVDGTTHPMYPNAPAVSWPSTKSGYIEFMESAFTVEDDYLHKLIVHEKSHFLWARFFSSEIKDEWTKLGGWYRDSKSSSGWSTKKTTEFVSAYSHQVNPDEDMAESIAHYVINPDKLKSRSAAKYQFLKDRIMEGNIYIPTVREDLTFDVFNLYPDYIYPGKIVRVDISIKGAVDEDKNATIEIELSGKNKFAGAKSAYLRLTSEQGTYKDITLTPVNGDVGLVLRGTVTINSNAKGGLWKTDQIVLTDQVNNQRFNGQSNFGWKFFVNNSNEDITPPSYVKRSLKITMQNDYTTEIRPVQVITASWKTPDKDVKSCYATIDNADVASYSIGTYGWFDGKTNMCVVNFKITEYFRPGHYSIKQIVMYDNAGNDSTVKFEDISGDNFLSIRTTNPDTEYPYLDVNNISVSATPTNPSDPNGETNVKIVYYAKDNKSGLGPVSFILRDPQGIQHNYYHYHKNFYSVFFDGNPNTLARYDINLVLPEGSAPGKWALVQMNLSDKANNSKSYQFVELIHFEILN